MNRRAIAGSIPVALALAAVLGVPLPTRAQSAGATPPAKPAASRSAKSSATSLPAPVQPITVGPVTDIDPRKAFGSKNAPVIVEIFSDFQCPACKNLYLATNRQVMDNYVSTGKIYLIHRDFPLQLHAHSRVAALYARAASQIGRLEPVEQALFENQERWEATGDVDGIVASAVSATDMKKIRDLVKSGTLEPLIEKDMALGRMHNVNQTPTTEFYAHGQTYPYAGQINYEFLKQFLDQLLAQK